LRFLGSFRDAIFAVPRLGANVYESAGAIRRFIGKRIGQRLRCFLCEILIGREEKTKVEKQGMHQQNKQN
jgi:hypothetical protein